MRKPIVFAAAVFSALGLVSTTLADEVKVKIINTSSFEIHELYFAATKQTDWGQDQLQDEVIKKGESFELRKIPVGKYDVKIVDEDGDECIISAVKVVNNEDVTFDDSTLVGCQAATEAESSDDEESDE